VVSSAKVDIKSFYSMKIYYRMIISVDVGGTFTDVVGVESGKLIVYKGPTTPRAPEIGVMEGVKKVGVPQTVVHATTIATNALLGQVNLELPKIALITTKGFRDVIEIGRQNRPELYNPFFQKPTPLVPRNLRYEVSERVGPEGEMIEELKEKEVNEALDRAKTEGVTSIAISFLHSYLNPSNERRAKELAERQFKYVSVSHEVSPAPREYERTSTTVVNAALMPVVKSYLDSLFNALKSQGTSSLFVMSSSGGLIDVEEAGRRPVQIIESGPAAGVVGVSALSRLMGESNAISFDMGGTTAKAGTVVNYQVETTQEYEVGGRTHYGRLVKGSGYPVRFPFVDLAEVSAGGGTIIWIDESGGLRVGPLSAGADPGPMCYDKGGDKPTLTDASLFLGRIGDTLSEGMKLRKDLAERGLRALGDPVEVSSKAIALATLEMARAIRLVTVERGYDPSSFTMFAFGGAGPQFAVELAEEMGVKKVVVTPHPGLFSALGMLMADMKFEASIAYPRDIKAGFLEIEDEMRKAFPNATFQRFADVRYEGQGWELTIPVNDPEKVEEEFKQKHFSTYGFLLDRRIEMVTIRSFAVMQGVSLSLPSPRREGNPSVRWRDVFLDGQWVKTKILRREEIPLGYVVEGPAIVEEYSSTTLIKEGWRAEVHETGSLVIKVN
jgi:N-methylhydantoinase A